MIIYTTGEARWERNSCLVLPKCYVGRMIWGLCTDRGTDRGAVSRTEKPTTSQTASQQLWEIYLEKCALGDQLIRCLQSDQSFLRWCEFYFVLWVLGDFIHWNSFCYTVTLFSQNCLSLAALKASLLQQIYILILTVTIKITLSSLTNLSIFWCARLGFSICRQLPSPRLFANAS